MRVDAQDAGESLRTIAQAQSAAARHSQNNGAVLLVWGWVVLVMMAGFDLFPALAARWYGPQEAAWYGPLLAACFLVPVVVGAAFWTGRYVRLLPVRPREPGNRWLFVRDRLDGRVTCGSGWWSLYHVLVVFGGFGIALWATTHLHRHGLPPFTWTVIGLIDSAPLLLTGWAQWRRARREGAAHDSC